MAVVTAATAGTIHKTDTRFAAIYLDATGDVTSMTTDTDFSEIFPIDMTDADQSYETIQGRGIIATHASTVLNRFQVEQAGLYRVTFDGELDADWVSGKGIRLYFQKSSVADFSSDVSVLGFTAEIPHNQGRKTASSQGQSDDVTYFNAIRAFLEQVGRLERGEYIRVVMAHDQAGTVAVTVRSACFKIEMVVQEEQ